MYSIIWLIAAAVLAIIEAFTLGLSTIWFAGGAVAAAIIALLDVSIWAQIFVFLGVSVILIVLTRPVAQKKLNIGREKTNIQTIIGQTGLVIEDILPYKVGRVRLGGQEWSGIGKDGSKIIKEGTFVRILNVEGVKLIVEEKDKEGECNDRNN